MKRAGLFAVTTALFFLNAAFAGDLAVTAPGRVGMSAERLQVLREELQALVDDGEFAGFQIVISRRGSVVMHEGFGVVSTDTGKPVNDDTRFRIFSMTKPIVATAMMILFEDGRFSLQDPIDKFIPEFAGLKVFAGVDESGEIVLENAIRPPTIHDLFQHTAGFTYGIFGDSPVDKLYQQAGVLDSGGTLDDFIEKLSGLPLLFQPGTRYNYSVASDVQGFLIETLTGMDTENFIQQRILDPLKMDETVSWVRPPDAGKLANIHTHGEDGELSVFADPPDAPPFVQLAYRQPTAFSGGGQLISTGDDYWRFAQMLLNGGELDGKRILSPLTVRLMTSNRLPSAIPDRSVSPGWGYGFNLGVVKDSTLTGFPTSDGEFRHGGLATTIFTVDPELELVVVFMNQYLPNRNVQFYDLLHRLVRTAIVD